MATAWKPVPNKKKFAQLEENIEVDVAIVGGGLCGVLSAYLLSKAGKKVALFEKKELGSYATLETTAFITQILDTPLSEFETTLGRSDAKLIWESGGHAIDTIEKIVDEEKIDCEFMRCSAYNYASTKQKAEALKEETSAYRRLEFKTTWHEAADLPFPNAGSFEMNDQAKFHPGKFLMSVAERAEKNGAQIYEKTEVVAVGGQNKIFLETSKAHVIARSVIIATYQPFTNEQTHFKKGMYRSYVYELRIPSGVIPEALYWNNNNPYHYFRIDAMKGHDRVIFGGEDHKDIFKGERLNRKSYQGLERYIARIFKNIDYKIVEGWDGPILEPSDGLALIGEIKPNYYVASAFSGNGMTYSTISAMLFRDVITGKKNPWIHIYDPKRPLISKKTILKARDYTEEFFGGALKNLLH